MITPKLTIDERATNAYLKTLARNEGKPLKERAQRTINAAAKRRVVPALKAAAPKGPRKTRRSGGLRILGKRRKTMRSSAKAKLLRQRGGEDIRPTWAGYTAFHARLVIEGTRSHSLATRRLEAGARGRWTMPNSSNFGVSNWRSGFAHFADGEVRPLAPITVRGVTPHPIVDQAWSRSQSSVLADVRRDVFAVK